MPIVIRFAIAAFGGYGATVAFSVLLTYVLPIPRADATLAAILCAFPALVVAFLWAFAARTPLRAALAMAVTVAICFGLAGMTVAVGLP